VFLICVPTPLTLDQKPDLSYLVDAIMSIGSILKRNNLVIIESTVEPGTIRNTLLPLLEKSANMLSGEFHLAYSPERIDPGNKVWEITNVPKLVSGFNDLAKQKALDFYGKFVKNLVPCTSIEVAESAKLLENSFRLVNISFVNEFSKFCHKMNIDVNEVIAAASTKPYGFMPFYPSIGVGGHCIPIDPVYLAHKAKEIGVETQLIDLAVAINQKMPDYYIKLAEELLFGLGNKKILVLGVSYKSNISDVRETPVSRLLSGLSMKGALVDWHDDLVKEWNGSKSVPISNNYDLAIVATPHEYFDLAKLGNVPILNSRDLSH
jgi:UDP-N-acetyl-D-glucosamine dehydrogenase